MNPSILLIYTNSFFFFELWDLRIMFFLSMSFHSLTLAILLMVSKTLNVNVTGMGHSDQRIHNALNLDLTVGNLCLNSLEVLTVEELTDGLVVQEILGDEVRVLCVLVDGDVCQQLQVLVEVVSKSISICICGRNR